MSVDGYERSMLTLLYSITYKTRYRADIHVEYVTVNFEPQR